LGVEIDIAWLATTVSEHDVGVDVGIQIYNPTGKRLDLVTEGRPRLGISGAITTAIVSGPALNAVTVDVHADELPMWALEIDDIEVFQIIAAIGKR
jgi:hypothetical protein